MIYTSLFLMPLILFILDVDYRLYNQELRGYKVEKKLHSELGEQKILNTTDIKNSVAWVRERTVPTERPLLVGEVSTNVCWKTVPRGQRDGSLRPYSQFSGSGIPKTYRAYYTRILKFNCGGGPKICLKVFSSIKKKYTTVNERSSKKLCYVIYIKSFR
jgi:hypothetical protein